MKELTLKVPNEKVDFFMELFEQLNVEVADNIQIPEKHKTIVRERIQKSRENPDRLLDWNKIKDDF